MKEPTHSGQWVKPAQHVARRDVEIVDCTLRDGEQAPGVWLTVQQKVNLAHQLSDAGVDVLDAGFPASGEEEIESLRIMRREGLTAKIGATSRLVRHDIDAAVEAQAEAIFLFAPVSDRQFELTLNLDRERLVMLFDESARYAASAGLEVSLVFGDATQADPKLIRRLVTHCERLPVERIVLCDSMGIATPAAMSALVRVASGAAPRTKLCVHCHNDFGMATANTLAAIAAGASSFTATVNGIGERAGNADLAEVVAAITHLLRFSHHLDPAYLPALSRSVERMTGIHMSPIKAVTGLNVYRHESGIHVDAILKDPASYQALPPEWTGARMELVLGKHSGAAQIRALLESRSLARDPTTVGRMLSVLKQSRHLCDRHELDEMLDRVEQFRGRVLGGIPLDAVLARVFEGEAKCEAG